MIKKVELHVDAIAVIVLLFVASFGFNLYQRYQYSDLMKEHVELQWKAQDTEINWKYVKGLLEICREAGQPDRGAAPGTE